MVTLFNVAVGFVWLPVVRDRDAWHAWPGLLVGLFLVLFEPVGALPFVFGLALSSTFMAPAMRLVSSRPRTNCIMGLLFLAPATTSLLIPRSITEPVAILRAAVEVVLLPVGIVLVGTAASRGHRTFAPIAASLLFIAAFTVWIGRDYFHSRG